ncbi:MAG: TPM domain-containing protein [Thermoanaerobaculales bacterium]|nr:TPM domain-containing protein [Thermoanaerobaculales bacterium]
MRVIAGRRVVMSSVMVVLVLAVTAGALDVPYLSGRVNDQAMMLEETFEGQLEEQLRLLEEETGAQVAVLTIASLEGDPIEDFSIRVVQTWKLGREGVDDGVLLLVARDDRRMRIEVGYGLEGALTDAQAGRIIDSLMTPRFREGDFEGGIGSAVGAISAAVRGEALELPESRPDRALPNIATYVFFLIFGLPFINAALSSRGAAGWVLYLFLAPFFLAVPAAIFGVRVGVVAVLAWLIGFPLLRMIWPKASSRKTGSRGGGTFWGPFVGGGGGGGGFSGGGGSFGGGGASGGW